MMKSIFKLYVFKLVILSLTIIFISFKANASQIISVETLYDYCAIFKKNNFKYKGLDPSELRKSTICVERMIGYVEAGAGLCRNYNYFYKRFKEAKILNDTHEHFFDLLEDTSGNQLIDYERAIKSYMSFVEKNTNLFRSLPFLHTTKFLSKQFPCKINKTPKEKEQIKP